MSPVKGSRSSKKKKQNATGRVEELKKVSIEDPPVEPVTEKDEFYDADSPPSDEESGTTAVNNVKEGEGKAEEKAGLKETEEAKENAEEEEPTKAVTSQPEMENGSANFEAEFDEFVEADQTVFESSDTTHKALQQKVQNLINIPFDVKLDIDSLLKKCQAEGRELMSKYPRTTSHQSKATIISNLRKELIAQNEK